MIANRATVWLLIYLNTTSTDIYHFSSKEHNAFYTANSGLFRTLPPSFLTKEKQILALIFMKKIEK